MNSLDKLTERFTIVLGTPASIVIHTLLFIGIFVLTKFGFTIDNVLLILTTAVSLEAIYLAIFIQMTVNRTTTHLADVKEDISDIQEDVEDIQENIDDLEENVDDIQEDVEGLETNVKEISEDYDENDKEENDLTKALSSIENHIKELQKDIETLKKRS